MHLTIFSSAVGMHVASRMERDRGKSNLQREAWTFSLLFIYSFISAGSRPSLKGQRWDERNVFPPNKEKLTRPARTVSTGPWFILFSGPCSPAL